MCLRLLIHYLVLSFRLTNKTVKKQRSYSYGKFSWARVLLSPGAFALGNWGFLFR